MAPIPIRQLGTVLLTVYTLCTGFVCGEYKESMENPLFLNTGRVTEAPDDHTTEQDIEATGHPNWGVHRTTDKPIHGVHLADVLSFIPNTDNCDDVDPDGRFTISASIQRKVNAYNATVELMQPREVAGYLATSCPPLYRLYLHIAQLSFMRTVCEVGFNAGHSSMGWLTANPNLTVYSFDLGAHKYGRRMVRYLEAIYPGRHNITWGDSTEEVPRFHKQHPHIKCDLILVDGANRKEIVRDDLQNLHSMASENNILLFDYYYHQKDTWEAAKQQGHVREIFHCTRMPQLGIAIGQFIM